MSYINYKNYFPFFPLLSLPRIFIPGYSVSPFTAASVFPTLFYFVHIKYGCFPQLNFKPYGFPPFLYLAHVKYGCFPQLNFKPHAFPPLLHFHYTINMGYLKKYISKLSSSKGASISAKSPLPIPLLYSL